MLANGNLLFHLSLLMYLHYLEKHEPQKLGLGAVECQLYGEKEVVSNNRPSSLTSPDVADDGCGNGQHDDDDHEDDDDDHSR